MGSEMCIRDRYSSVAITATALTPPIPFAVHPSISRQYGTAASKETHLLGGDVVPLGKAGLFLVGGHRVVPVLVKPRPVPSHETRKICGGAWENHEDDLLSRDKPVL